MKIALTGANGGLGSLLRKSLENEHEIITFGRHHSDFAWSLGVVPSPEQLEGIEAIIHCAWSTTARKEDLHLNIGGTGVLSRVAQESQIPYLFISSVAAMSQSFYGRAKLQAEALVLENHGTCLRIGLVKESNPYLSNVKKFIGIAPRLPGYVNVTEFKALEHFSKTWLAQVQTDDQKTEIETVISSNLFATSMFARQYKIPIPVPFWALKIILNSTRTIFLRSSNLLDAMNSLVSTPRITP
jgi:dTDP-4-dehydrorhamnose reductase